MSASNPHMLSDGPRRFSIRLARWIVQATIILVVIAVGLRRGVPKNQEQVAIWEIQRLAPETSTGLTPVAPEPNVTAREISAAESDRVTAPTVEIVSAGRFIRDDCQFVAMSCLAANPNHTSISLVGYGSGFLSTMPEQRHISPLYVVQFQQAGKWQKYRHGWCGVGIEHIELPRGDDGAFNCLDVRVEPTWTAIRVGIYWTVSPDPAAGKPGGSGQAWSQPLILDQIDERCGEDRGSR